MYGWEGERFEIEDQASLTLRNIVLRTLIHELMRPIFGFEWKKETQTQIEELFKECSKVETSWFGNPGLWKLPSKKIKNESRNRILGTVQNVWLNFKTTFRPQKQKLEFKGKEKNKNFLDESKT